VSSRAHDARYDARVVAEIVIRTSEKAWFEALARAYRAKDQVLIVDDAGVGIDPRAQTLLDMGLRGKLGPGEWGAALTGLGMGVAGVVMVLAAVFDPEPTSKLGLLVGTGAVLAVTGGLGAIGVLTRRKPPDVRVSRDGIHVTW
jgi:hypothetical protein